MQNELCERLGIEFPIFAFTHCRDVVAAVSNAGGLGVLGAVGFTPEQLETELAWIDEHVGDKPYGVDIVIPMKYEGMGEMNADKLEDELREMIPEYRARHRVKPGLTGLAQINQHYDQNLDDVRGKIRWDLEYIRTQSLWLDIMIMLKTVPSVLLKFRGW